MSLDLGKYDLKQAGDFQKMINEVQEKEGWSDDDMARLLMTSRPTIRRWRTGQSSAHPMARDVIRNRILEVATSLEEEDQRSSSHPSKR